MDDLLLLILLTLLCIIFGKLDHYCKTKLQWKAAPCTRVGQSAYHGIWPLVIIRLAKIVILADLHCISQYYVCI